MMRDYLLKSVLIATTVIGLGGCRSMLPFEARYIPSGSMEPSLQINDRIWVDKAKASQSNLTRGNIIIFNPTPTLKQLGFRDAFVARVIGLPGEEISFRNGQVYINQSPLEETYVQTGAQTRLDLCEGEGGSGTPSPFSQPTTIPAQAYIVLGDNRENSFDGRCWGYVTTKEIRGKVVYRYWPPERAGTIQPIKY